MVCHLYLFQDNAITFDTSSGHLVQATIFGAIYCGAPLIYSILASIYYKVCIPSNPFKSRFFKNYIFIGLPQLTKGFTTKEVQIAVKLLKYDYSIIV